MNRRRFLQGGLVVGGLSMFGFPGALSALARPGRMLVAVHLAGGNDGLNTVVPYTDPLYRRARPELALRDSDLWQPGGALAFHGALSALRPWWEAGQLAVVNGVGYPQPVRSHFRSADVWQTGSSAAAGSGWLGRTLEQSGGVGISLDTPLNRSLWSDTRPSLAVGPADTFHLDGGPALGTLDRLYRESTMPHLQSTWNDLQRALSLVRKPARLPGGERGKALSTLLAFMPSAEVYHLTLGGFDTHSNQKPRQARALQETAEALAAWWRQVEARGWADRTVLMVYSEFGRRVEENASGGTDHGAAGPLFLLGGGVKGGWYGSYPSLSDLGDGDLRYQVDFRQVYASILEGWLGQRSRPVLGEAFATLPLWA